MQEKSSLWHIVVKRETQREITEKERERQRVLIVKKKRGLITKIFAHKNPNSNMGS